MENTVKMQVQEKIEKMFGGTKKTKHDPSNSLQRFLDSRRDPGSRFKHLRLVLDAISDTAERKMFMEQHSFELYHLFHELMCQVESLSSQYPGPRLAVNELECAFWLLETIFCYLPELIAQRWQYSGIVLVMKQLLHSQNFLGIRRLAVRLFLQWYQILGVGPYGCPELDPFFNSLVPFLPVTNGTTDRYLTELCEQPYIRNTSGRRSIVPDASSVGAVTYLTKRPSPFTSPPSIDKNVPNAQNSSKSVLAQSFMEKILEYISGDVTKIQWSGNKVEIQKRCLRLLMEKLRRYYVSACVIDPSSVQYDIFRPKLIPANFAISGNGVNGTLADTSSETADDPVTTCRHALIRWVAVYAFSHKKASDSLNNSNMADGSFGTSKDGLSPRAMDIKVPPNFELVRDCLFGSKPMVNFVFAMFRESFLLPLAYASTMGRVFKTLREWLLADERPSFFNEPTLSANISEPYAGLQLAYMAVIYVLSSFFNNPYLYKDEERAALIIQISAKILALFRYMACSSCQLSQETWQYLLKTLIIVVGKNIPLSPPVHVDITRPTLVQRLSGHLFQTLLIAWVYAGLYGSVSNEMWDELLEMLSARTSWPELISEWGKVVESVTRALGVAVYGVDILDLPLERLSEQKLIKRQGASRGQIPESQDAQKGHATMQHGQAEGGLTVATPMYDFVQGSPVSNGPAPQQGSGQPVNRYSDVSVTGIGGTVRGKPSLPGSAPRQLAGASGSPAQMQSPEEASLDGSSSWDSSGPTVSSNDCETHVEGGKESLFDNELLVTTANPGEDCDDSVSEEFVIAEDGRGTCDDGETKEVDEESVVAACGPANVYVVWKRILGCLGDINQLQKPELHLGCLQSLEQLAENLFKIKDNQNVDVTNQQQVVPPIIVPQQLVIATWLLDALHLSERYHESKVIALRLLCRIMVNQHRVPPSTDPAVVAQFHAVLHESLVSGVEELAGTILTECGTNIFTNMELYNGSLLLLYDFLRGAALLLSSDAAAKPDRVAATRFLAAVACLPGSTTGECSCIGSDWNVKQIQGDIIQKELVHLMLKLVRSNVETGLKIESVKGLGLFLADRLSHGETSGETETENTLKFFLEILPFCGPGIGLLMCSALQPLRELLPPAKRTAFVWNIVEVLSLALEHTLRNLISFKYGQQEGFQQEQFATRLALDLIDWCVLMPADQLSQLSGGTIWKLVEVCYSSIARCGGGTEIHRTATLVSRLLLTFLSSRFNQGGTTQSFTREDFSGDTAQQQPPFVLSMRKSSIVSTQQRQLVSRLLFRHGGGKRCWDMISVRSMNAPISTSAPVSPFDSWLVSSIRDQSASELDQDAKKSTPGKTIESRDSKDSLERLMRLLNTTSPECFISQITFDQPTTSDYSFTTIVNEEAVLTAINQMQLKARNSNGSETNLSDRVCQRRSGNANFTGHKFLLGSSGLLSWDNHCGMVVSALDNKSERLQRELKHLDGLLLSEAHKIAVLYVADGQEDKQSILANRRGSSTFEDFIAALGWEVDLKTHCGYAGGLSADVHLTTTYYATATTETVFHVSTRLPNDDPTKNLRHLGNDEVHIVWSEHWRDYRRSIIATEFCDVLIVIYPLENIPFYKIHIDKRPEIGDIGPLTDGMLVPWPVLPALVRCTAINASRAKRTSVANYKNFYEHRLDSLTQAIEKLQSQSSYSNLLSAILKLGDESRHSSNHTHKILVRSS